MHGLLIGGAGFIGSSVARALVESGHKVTVLGRKTRTSVPGVELLLADRRDPEAIAQALEGMRFDFTVDLAAYDAEDVERLLLVPYAALGRYLLISSGQVYLVTESKAQPFREEDAGGTLAPEPPAESADHAAWRYGVGKRRAERALLALRASHGVRGLILRLPVVLGVADPTRRLWAYIERFRDGGPLLLPDGGTRLTRFIYVEDVAQMLVRVISSGIPRDPVFNFAGPEVHPLRSVLDRVAVAAGIEPRFVNLPREDFARLGLDASALPFSGHWVSVLDPARAAAQWGILGSPLDDYLPGIVHGMLERPLQSHPGYAQRAAEIEVASRLATATS